MLRPVPRFHAVQRGQRLTDPRSAGRCLVAERFDQLSPAHQDMATEISERALALQIEVNDRRPIDGPIELRALLVRLLDAGA